MSLLEDITYQEEDDEELPDYSNWNPKTTSDFSSATVVKSVEDNTDDDLPNYSEWVPPSGTKKADEESSPSVKSSNIKSDLEIKKSPSEMIQESLLKMTISNEEEEFSFIPKQRKEKKGNEKQKKQNKYDFSDILYDLDSDTDTEEEETLSYEEWKERQHLKQRGKGPLDMLESLRKMTDQISPLDRPLNPQMTDAEHRMMVSIVIAFT